MKLKGASLSGADLRNANLDSANLTNALLGGREMTMWSDVTEEAFVRHVEWTKPGANLSGAVLSDADARDAYMVATNLRDAKLRSANLARAGLEYSSLFGADLTDTELKDADVREADFQDAIFEPKSIPEIRSIAAAKNLDLLTYDKNPNALAQLRKEFEDGGFRSQERKITYAIKRKEAELSRPGCTSRMLPDGGTRSMVWSSDSNLANCGSFVLDRVFFDWTCQYGMSPGRPLSIGVLVWALCSILYFLSARASGVAGLYRVYAQSLNDDGQGSDRVERISPRAIPERRGVRRLLRLFWREWVVLLRASMFFSLMSAFNIGFRDINFGRWLRLLTRQEFDIKAIGWARVIAGW